MKKENKVKQEKVRKVFLDDLPRRGKTNQINWKECKGYSFNFQWDNIFGVIQILDVKREGKISRLLLKYKNNTMWTNAYHIKECKISMLIGIKTYDYTYKVGDIINNNERNIVINKLIRNKKYKTYEYKCLTCEYVGTTTESHIRENKGCPVCSNNKVIKGINDIATTHPHLVKYFKNIEDTYIYSFGSDKKVCFKCPDCGSEKKLKIGVFIKIGFSCPKCGDGISMPNKIMFNILEQLNLNFEAEYSPKWCKYELEGKLRKGRYDFYIPSINIIVEMDGGFHDKNNSINKQTAKNPKEIDNCKDNLAKEHKIKVIRIDCDYYGKEPFEFIKQNILINKALNKLIDINKIDWNKVFQYTLTNNMKEACDLWSKGEKIENIAKIFKVHRGTVVNYLNKGSELNMCDYNGLINMKTINSKKVKCIEYNLVFNSISECAEKLSKELNTNFTIGCISQVCLGKRKTHRKLHFEFI